MYNKLFNYWNLLHVSSRMYCYAKFLPFVIYIVKAAIIIIIKIMIYVTAFRYSTESFLRLCVLN